MNSSNHFWLLPICFVLTCSPVFASFTVCNNTAEDLSLATAHSTRGFFTSEGWWNLSAGECAMVYAQDISDRYFYLRGTGRGIDVRGDNYFCLLPDKEFSFDESVSCADGERRRQGFRKIDTGGQSDWTYSLNPSNVSSPGVAAEDIQQSPASPVASGAEQKALIVADSAQQDAESNRSSLSESETVRYIVDHLTTFKRGADFTAANGGRVHFSNYGYSYERPFFIFEMTEEFDGDTHDYKTRIDLQKVRRIGFERGERGDYWLTASCSSECVTASDNGRLRHLTGFGRGVRVRFLDETEAKRVSKAFAHLQSLLPAVPKDPFD